MTDEEDLESDYNELHEGEVCRCNRTLFFFNFILMIPSVFFITQAFYKNNNTPTFDIRYPQTYLAIQNYVCTSFTYSKGFQGLYEESYGEFILLQNNREITKKECRDQCDLASDCVAFSHHEQQIDFDQGEIIPLSVSKNCQLYSTCTDIHKTENQATLNLNELKIDENIITFLN